MSTSTSESFIMKMQNDKKYIVLILLVIGLILNLSYVASPTVQQTEAYASTLAIFIFIVGIIIRILVSNGGGTQFIILGFDLVAVLLYVLFTNSIEVYLTNIIRTILLIGIITVGIATANNLVGQYINRFSRHIYAKFFIDLILYIPCMFSDFIAGVKTEYGLTSSVTFILLGLEAVFITLYVLLPKILELSIQSKDGVTVIEKPLFLDVETSPTFIDDRLTSLARYNDLGQTISRLDYDKNTMNINYAFSMWVFLNQQNKQNSESLNVFSYSDSYPQVYVTTRCQVTGNDIYIIKLYALDTGYEFKSPNQKWNNFIFNYNDNKIDLFVNGNLEKTTSRSTTNIQSNSKIKIGADNGLYGAICNVRYFKTPLSKNTIVNSYNFLMKQNPPINNIV